VRDACPRILDVPRWMFARYAAETIGELRTWLARAREARFRHAWERAHLAGYIAQAWRGGSAPRVVVSSVSGALGGMEWRMALEARILAHAGYRSSLALPAFPGVRHLATELAPVGVPVRIWAPPQFLEHWRWHRLRFVRARVDLGLRRLRPDLLHVAFCWTAYGASLLWLAQRRAIPTVISVHNAFPAATFSGWQRERMAEALRTVRGVYAVSESALTHFLGVYADLLPAGVRLAVIPNCVDAQRFLPCSLRRAAARARLGLADDALVLGCVARLAEQKQPGRLIDLARQLLPRFPRLRLLLIGDGPLGPGLRARVRAEGLGEVVCFTGHLEAVEDVLPALDLHLLLSRNEGFGIATIEAMACAVPVLATDVPGNSDVLRGSRGGLLVPPDCAPALAAEVAALLDDPQRRAAMGRCGRAEVQERFAPALMEQRVRDFYTGLLP
jgi:glycosyltransferase involved in cell wall biosynthesis